MHKSVRRLVLLALVVMLLFPAVVAWAAPPALPASFYGRVRVAGSSATTGSIIFVYAGEVEVATVAVTQDPSYGSVYALNIPADNPGTALIDGGQEGDTLAFWIQLPNLQRMRAVRTSVWHSGASVALDLNFGTSNVYLPLFMKGYQH